jgi:glucose-1-phosphate adenylyltransferase
MLAANVEADADITVGCIEVPLHDARGFGVMSVDRDNRIVEFAEKPADPTPMPGREDVALASMGIYVFRTEVLIDELLRDSDDEGSRHDFGADIIPQVIKRLKVMAFPFREPGTETQAYWRDVGTIDAYWQANMELVGISPEFNLYDRDWPIWTYQDQVPPAKFIFDDEGRRGMGIDSMVAGGCIVSGSYVRRSLLFSNVHVHSYSHIEDSVIFPNVEVGRRSIIKKAVVDKGCIIPPGTRIGVDADVDAARYYVSPGGVILVTPEMLGQRLHYAR